MSDLSDMSDVLEAEVITLGQAPTAAKHALAKRAWDSLPLEQRWPDNLTTLKQAATTDPRGFLELCRREGLTVDFSIVINHHEEHHHHHHQAPNNGITREDLAYLVEAMRPQQESLTTADVLALIQSQTPIYQPPIYEPPTYYPPPEYHPHFNVEFSPHIGVSSASHSHSKEDSGGDGRSVAFVILLWASVCLFITAVTGSK